MPIRPLVSRFLGALLHCRQPLPRFLCPMPLSFHGRIFHLLLFLSSSEVQHTAIDGTGLPCRPHPFLSGSPFLGGPFIHWSPLFSISRPPPLPAAFHNRQHHLKPASWRHNTTAPLGAPLSTRLLPGIVGWEATPTPRSSRFFARCWLLRFYLFLGHFA